MWGIVVDEFFFCFKEYLVNKYTEQQNPKQTKTSNFEHEPRSPDSRNRMIALSARNNSSSTKTAFIRRAIKYGSRMIKSGYDAHKIVGRVQAFSRFDPTKGDWLTVRSKITRGLLTP